MKKLGLICVAVLTALSLAGCSSSASQKTANSAKSAKVVKHHKTHKKTASKGKKDKAKKKSKKVANGSKQPQQSAQQSSSQQTAAQTTGQQPTHVKTQGEINMERGYDPKGNPLLPGQDHAAGCNPDGTPDAWVQGQINWAIRNGYMNPDGTDTEKVLELHEQAEHDYGPYDDDDNYDYDY